MDQETDCLIIGVSAIPWLCQGFKVLSKPNQEDLEMTFCSSA
jgi:hypothetical protein